MAGWIWLLLFPLFLFAESVETFYGALDVEEPVLIELIHAGEFQRLKKIHQYGASYYDRSHPEEFTRYDHSLGVFAILRMKGFSLKEQIAGLLHDVSHTVFSHVGDWMYDKQGQGKDYQNSIHELFLKNSSLGKILEKYGYRVEEVLPEKELFPGLERELPDLCADRIDYNLQGAYHKKMITKAEALSILDDLEFLEGDWVCHDPRLMAKVVRFSLHMTKTCWGSPHNHFISTLLAEAMLRGIELGVISKEEVHTGTDELIWEKLIHSDDALIQKKINALFDIDSSYAVVEGKGDLVVHTRFRGIDPWVINQGQKKRLTTLDAELAGEYFRDRDAVAKGWSIKLLW